MQVSKLEAIKSQLTTAIQLLFTGGDPVAVHTLIGAASILSFDLVEKKFPGGAWEHYVLKTNDITKLTYIKMAREAQNFFKHAVSDPDAVLEFRPEQSEVLLWAAMQNYLRLLEGGERKLPELSVYELWFIAKHHMDFDTSSDKVQRLLDGADSFFPRLAQLSLDAQKLEGSRLLKEYQADLSGRWEELSPARQ